jgi:hypothetical protein
MNKRINQLFGQALDQAVPETWTTLTPAQLLMVKDKFAELIVRECVEVAVNKDSGYMHPANVAGYMAAGRSTAAQMIKEHFGVAE